MLQLATEADFDAINRIGVQSHDLHVSWRPDIYCHCDELFSKEYYLEAVEERRLFAAKLNGMVVGFVLFLIWETNGPGNVKRKVMNIDSIAVEETCRDHGIGKAMMEDLHALAKAYGCTDMALSVYPQNDAAIAFYQRCGFTIRNINMNRKV